MSNERIDYKHFASKYTYGTGQDGRRWTKAELKILLDEIARCYAFIDSHGLDEDIEHKMVIDLRECSIELLNELCFQAGLETGTKEEMIARLLE